MLPNLARRRGWLLGGRDGVKTMVVVGKEENGGEQWEE